MKEKRHDACILVLRGWCCCILKVVNFGYNSAISFEYPITILAVPLIYTSIFIDFGFFEKKTWFPSFFT